MPFSTRRGTQEEADALGLLLVFGPQAPQPSQEAPQPHPLKPLDPDDVTLIQPKRPKPKPKGEK